MDPENHGEKTNCREDGARELWAHFIKKNNDGSLTYYRPSKTCGRWTTDLHVNGKLKLTEGNV